MNKIFKYNVPMTLTETFNINMPKDSEVIDVQMQDSQFGQGIFIWAVVDTSKKVVPFIFEWIPTGGNIPEYEVQYLKTLQLQNGLVFHLFNHVDNITEL